LEVTITDIKTQAIIAGLVFMLVYLLVKRFKPTLSESITVFTNGAGVWGGLWLGIVSINKFTCASESLEQGRLIVMVGAIATLWMCFSNIKNKFLPPVV
jgi:hypothetical protein